ncbi:hypothetical protein BD289DRAFT_103589 [Coniella lustricola]|uniref:Uncharacterized protein n=1 Tax=Coniella lustricola TaxID=2025994 RepID=A0A2T2ZXX6_9PEZI|nr:hypothetical protein BD289DRAFT_103589 [Coniella lustricola]
METRRQARAMWDFRAEEEPPGLTSAEPACEIHPRDSSPGRLAAVAVSIRPVFLGLCPFSLLLVWHTMPDHARPLVVSTSHRRRGATHENNTWPVAITTSIRGGSLAVGNQQQPTQPACVGATTWQAGPTDGVASSLTIMTQARRRSANQHRWTGCPRWMRLAAQCGKGPIRPPVHACIACMHKTSCRESHDVGALTCCRS